MQRIRVAPWIWVVVALLAIAPRVEPALRGFRASPDAAEYLLIARSLRAGRGFELPIRVRHVEREPVAHSAYGERAPLYPWLLSAFVSPEPGWPSARLQLSGVALAALAALLACAIAAELAARRGLRGARAQLAVLVAGLSVAWQPFLVRASVHLWAEPLGVLLALGAVWAALRSGLVDASGQGEAAGPVWVVEALCVALARFARPEAWVLVPVFLALHLLAGRRAHALRLLTVVAAINLVLVAATGVIAPQLELFAVSNYGELMGSAPPAPVSAGSVARAIAGNALGQLKAALLPKNAALILPCALLALRREPVGEPQREGPARASSAARVPLAAAGGLALATVIVWSTSDPQRFTIAPLALLAPLAVVELIARLRAAPRVALAIALALWLGVMGHAAGRSMRGRGPEEPPPRPPQSVGALTSTDPWGYALWTGGAARLGEEPGAKSGRSAGAGR